jgi:Rieske Fe-S protein
MSLDDLRVPRQQVIRGAGIVMAAGALAACSKDGEKPDPTSQATATTGSGSTSAAPPTAAPQSGVIAKTSDVPVGSGVIVDAIVVTQPSPGVFDGFSSVCTHAGCAVNEVVGGTINCPCHGSKFNLDGSVAHGPATKPLEAKAVSVQGDSIILG